MVVRVDVAIDREVLWVTSHNAEGSLCCAPPSRLAIRLVGAVDGELLVRGG